MKIIDITPPITKDLAVFPGDTPFSRKVAMDFPQDHLALSSIETTLHLGAHADSSSHYHASGEGIEKRTLETYLGKCQVIHVKIPRGERITPADIKDPISAERILFHTESFPNPNSWNDDFNSLSPELIDFLASKGVILVGIDTPSVDPSTSKTLESHQALYRTKMAVLEGIVLTHANPGIYTLVALPLPIVGADASPVRAVLLQNWAT